MVGLWTTENIVNLKRFAGEGKTGTEIAAGLGYQFSRAAIIGKCRREGIPLISGMVARRVSSQPKKLKPKARRPRAPRPKPGFKQTSPILAASRMRRLTIIELRPTTCRWPLGDPRTPEFRYCGANGASHTGGRPYCPFHHAMAYETSQQRAARQAWSIRQGRPFGAVR